MKNKKYYGCDNPESISYLEFGAINIVRGEKTIWNYWQDQMAYDLYMFARYSKDLFSFRHFIKEECKTPQKLNQYILEASHNKLLDYIFKYVGLLIICRGGVRTVCESGSSLYGWIDEATACDYVYHAGKNIEKIKKMEYICSDISELMNEGARELHSSIKMYSSCEDTISGLVEDAHRRLQKNIDLFYGVSVSIRYAVREAADLVKVASQAKLSIYNRLSFTYDTHTTVLTYGTGKTVYIISLKELVEGLEKEGITAKYCEANMQYDKDGKNTARASLIMAKDRQLIDDFISEYENCIAQSAEIEGIERGDWKDIKELLKR